MLRASRRGHRHHRPGGRNCCRPAGPNFIVGTPGNDLLVGTKHRDFIVGRRGDDRLIGRKQNDVLLGGPGDDILRAATPLGHSGRDVLRGGLGTDRCIGDPATLPGLRSHRHPRPAMLYSLLVIAVILIIAYVLVRLAPASARSAPPRSG